MSTKKSKITNDAGKEEKVEAVMNRRRKLDFSKVSFSGKVVPSVQALEDVTPIDWSEEVKKGEKSATVFPLNISKERVDN